MSDLGGTEWVRLELYEALRVELAETQEQLSLMRQDLWRERARRDLFSKALEDIANPNPKIANRCEVARTALAAGLRDEGKGEDSPVVIEALRLADRIREDRPDWQEREEAQDALVHLADAYLGLRDDRATASREGHGEPDHAEATALAPGQLTDPDDPSRLAADVQEIEEALQQWKVLCEYARIGVEKPPEHVFIAFQRLHGLPETGSPSGHGDGDPLAALVRLSAHVDRMEKALDRIARAGEGIPDWRSMVDIARAALVSVGETP